MGDVDVMISRISNYQTAGDPFSSLVSTEDTT